MECESSIKVNHFISRCLPLIILIEGFVSIAIEILTIRQLLPVAGSSIIVTSLVIGIFLLFLALGYQRGGKLEQDFQKVLRVNFIIAASWLGIGLSSFFIMVFFSAVSNIMGQHVVYPLIGYLILIIAPLIFILGQTVPATMNMVKQNKSAGTIGGNTLGLSTIGSFFGAIFTTLVLMHFLGVAWTIFINFMFLIGLYLLLSENWVAFILQLIIATGMTLFIYNLNVVVDKGIFTLSNNYANYQIVEKKSGEKDLYINNSSSSYINAENKGFPYVEEIKKILFQELKLHDANILVLGAGGFTLSAENTYSNHFTYVDIDSELKKVVVPRFVNNIKGSLIIDDARHFISSSNKQYQAIIVDTYSNIRSIPAHLLTIEYMHEIQQRLAKNGVVIFNIIENPMLLDRYSKRMDNTIRAVFQNCMATPLTYKNRITNVLYVCSIAQNQTDNTIYSDNLNNSTTDYFDW